MARLQAVDPVKPAAASRESIQAGNASPIRQTPNGGASAASISRPGPMQGARFVNVSKTFDGASFVVKDLDLEIAPGEFLTLLGPSGSGKTTTLMMLAGFEIPSHGDIFLDDRVITKVPPYRRGIGMVFQNYALFPHMTVFENLAFPLQVRHQSRSEIEARVRRALDMVGLASLGHRRPNQLSGGQQQRVAVARALVFEPQLVLMDEPLGALDKQLREQMQLEIKRLHARLGITILYVTHDQSEALSISDRIGVFNAGAIQQLARPADLYDKPQSSFVARFIGDNNNPSGRVAALSGGRCRVVLASGLEVDATPVRISAVGDRTTLSIRPEQIRLDHGDGFSTSVAGQVEELVYLGDHLRAHVNVSGEIFVVKLAHAREPRLAVGKQVRLGWNASDCYALDPVQ